MRAARSACERRTASRRAAAASASRASARAFIAAASAASWVVTERYCDTIDFFKLFPGHVLWHVGMTLGLVNCLVLAALLRADNFRQHPRFIAGAGCLGRVYFALLPGLLFLADDPTTSTNTASRPT